MLEVPVRLASDPAFEPMLRMSEAIMLTPRELARHWRLSVGHLGLLRRQGKGPAHVQINGRVVYRHADILAYELRNGAGPVTPDSLALALASVPALPPKARDVITAHVTAVLFPPSMPKPRKPRRSKRRVA